MRLLARAALVLCMLVPLGLADAPACAPAGDCSVVSSRNRKQAERAFKNGVKAQRDGRADAALQHFEQATELHPYLPEYAAAAEMARQQVVFEHIERGNRLQGEQRLVEAAAAFRQALVADPKSEFARQRLADVLPAQVVAVDPRQAQAQHTLRLVAASDELDVEPKPGVQDFHFRGESRELLQQVATKFGLEVEFDPSFQSRRVRMDVEGVDFETAMEVAGRLSKTFWVPLSDRRLIVAADTRQNRQEMERTSLRTFAIDGAGTPAELNDYVVMLRGIFDVRFVVPQPARSLIYVRGPSRLLHAATDIVQALQRGRAQVMLEVKIFELNRSVLQQVGVDLPLQFNIFNVPTEARNLVSSPNLQELINRLISAGGLNQLDPAAIAALLAQLQSQGGSLLGQPLATFGGGKTLSAVVIPPVGVRLSRDASWLRSTQTVLLRAADGDTATFRSGSRYPILNASFTPIFNTAALSQAVQNQSYQAPFPSFTYEELGLTLKATPRVSAERDVTLQLELQMRSLGAQTFNQVPVVSNREFKTGISVHDGDTIALTGMITESEQRSQRGLPGFGKIPGVNLATGTRSDDVSSNHLLILITPRIARTAEATGGATSVTLPF